MKKYLIVLLALMLAGCAMQLNPPAAKPTPTASAKNQIPVTWSDQHLTGKLIYIGQQDTADAVFMVIQMLDLTSGQLATLFKAPDHAFIYALTLSPDHKQLIMSYALPSDKTSLGVPALYSMPVNASQPPKLLFAPSGKEDQYYQPLWATIQGKDYLYFSQARSKGPSKTGTQNLQVDLYRMALPDGAPEKIAANAFWPALSPDGATLVYVAINPADGTNQLISANPDGSAAHAIAATGEWVPRYIDAPAFLADGKTLLFSAVSISETKPAAWLDQLLGISVASAHNIPSDWWTVPVAGGAVTQLTHLQTTALFASLSPDQKTIASYSGAGLFLMNPDGSGVQMLVQDAGGSPSSLNWIP